MTSAGDAAAAVASSAPLVLPWENPKPDPDGISAAAVSLTAWVEGTCNRKLGSLIRCDFKWFSDKGDLSDVVETGEVAYWRDPSNPDEVIERPDSAPSKTADKKKKRRDSFT
jgi:hypothetical protein